MIEQLETGIRCLGQLNVHLKYYRRLPIVIKLMDSVDYVHKCYDDSFGTSVVNKKPSRVHV